MKDSDTSSSSTKRSKSRKKKRSAKRSPKAATPAPTPPPKSGGGATNSILIGIVALLVGAAGGWFLRDAKAAEDKKVEATPDTPAPAGSAAAGEAKSCTDWATKICAATGEEDEGCTKAKSAAKMLPGGACDQALTDVPGTVAKLKAARASCDELVKKACADLGEDTETCKMVKERTPTFPTSQCEEMLTNYAKVLNELKQMEKQNAPLSAEDAKKIASGNAASFGPEDAALTVVEFSDFECPYCAMAAETMRTLKERYGEKVRFVFRQFPLSFHKQAQLASEASLAALAQGKFWEFHDKVFENQREMSREDLESHAKEVGLDMAKFKKALDDHTYEKAVKDDIALGNSVGVSGTPSFFVGTKRIADPSVAGISTEIDAQLGGQ